MLIDRDLRDKIENNFNKGKAILLTGPRQVGKTTLINQLLKDKNYLFLDGDDPAVSDLLSEANTEMLRNIISGHDFVFIDEAQRIPNIGIRAKNIIDQIKGVQLIISGSSSLDLNDRLQEPLTGRKFEYNLYPVSWNEFEKSHGFLHAHKQFEMRLIYGMYPDVINNPGNEYEILKNLTSSYLYKDIFALTGIRKPQVLEDLVKALAFQVGSEVSYNELGQLVNIDKNTVSNYIDVLEKAFVVFRLNSFSRNLRNEIRFNRKIYFYDNGVRNMVIGNLNPIKLRQDKGALFENFMISERLKILGLQNKAVESYFWRTTAQQEIDYIETEADKVSAYEFKWSAKKKARLPAKFMETYHPEFKLITTENFRDFLNN